MRIQTQPARRKLLPAQPSERLRRCRNVCLCAALLLAVAAAAAAPRIMRRIHPFYPKVAWHPHLRRDGRGSSGSDGAAARPAETALPLRNGAPGGEDRLQLPGQQHGPRQQSPRTGAGNHTDAAAPQQDADAEAQQPDSQQQPAAAAPEHPRAAAEGPAGAATRATPAAADGGAAAAAAGPTVEAAAVAETGAPDAADSLAGDPAAVAASSGDGGSGGSGLKASEGLGTTQE